MIPKFCDLRYKPVKIGPNMLKCELQKKLMTTITTQIWQEKLKYDLEEIYKQNLIHAGWIQDPTAAEGTALMAGADKIAYQAGHCIPAGADYDPVAQSGEQYHRDTNGDIVLGIRGQESPVDPTEILTADNCWEVKVIKDLEAKNYFGNLDNLNTSVSNFLTRYMANEKGHHYIPHCLKKHLTHNQMDFYCLTDTDEVVDYQQMDAVAIEQIKSDMAKQFADKGPYKRERTSDGHWVIQNRHTHLGQGGHVYTKDADNQFKNPDERVNAMTQDFVDQGDIKEAADQGQGTQ